MMYYYQYKCRQCGAIFRPAGTTTKRIAELTLIIPSERNLFSVHMCNEHDTGIGDLLGFIGVEE